MSIDTNTNRRRLEEMSHAEAANELVGQVVRYERDRANRNDDRYDPQIKLASAQIHAILAVQQSISELVAVMSDE